MTDATKPAYEAPELTRIGSFEQVTQWFWLEREIWKFFHHPRPTQPCAPPSVTFS